MEFTQLVWNTLAVVGIGTLLYAAYRVGKVYLLHGEDGPIRVKGGSVTVENRLGDWEVDEEESDREYHTKGKPTGWMASVWKDEADLNDPPLATLSGRRVIVHCDDGSGGAADYRIVFRANGGVRVLDQNRKLTHSGNLLSNTSPGHRIMRVVAKTGSTNQVHVFAAGEKGYVKLVTQ